MTKKDYIHLTDIKPYLSITKKNGWIYITAWVDGRPIDNSYMDYTEKEAIQLTIDKIRSMSRYELLKYPKYN